jgi:transcriptional regulator with XRE-family HTH domain
MPIPRPAPVMNQVSVSAIRKVLVIEWWVEPAGDTHVDRGRGAHQTLRAPAEGYPAEGSPSRESLFSVSRRSVAAMDSRSEIREFLVSRRARLTPEDAGLPGGGNRRVPGLRRSEVATLAGVSVEYYGRLERGDFTGVSDGVLDALASALRLDEAEHAHLLDLVRLLTDSTPRRRRTTAAAQPLRPGIQRILDAITGAPAFVRNGRADILATNRLGRALYDDMYASTGRPVNHARFIFFDPRATRFYPNWDQAANDVVAILRTEAGHNPFDRGLSDLVGELSTRSDEFRTRWGAHNVRHHYTGLKHFHHAAIGDISLSFDAMQLSADEGLSLLIYTAAPGTPAEDAVRLLGTWAATQDLEDATASSTTET